MPGRPWQSLVHDLQSTGHESPYLDRLRARVDPEQSQHELERELVQEMASALGRAEDKVNAALLRLELAAHALDETPDGPEHAARLAEYHQWRDEALRARHELLIHREAVGFRQNRGLDQLYPIPARRR